MQLETFVQQVIVRKGNGVLFETIQEKYKSMQEEQECPFIRGIIPKNFKRWLSITFNDKLQYKKFKNGVEFVFCPNSSQFDEEDWSNDWKDHTNNEKLEDAAQIRRKEIMSLRSVFSSWPPLEKEMKEW